jgi:hypothetical protein
MVGSRATRSREPGQGRKAAAVSGVPGAPRECPAGASYRESAGRSWVQDGARGPLSIWWGESGAPGGTRSYLSLAPLFVGQGFLGACRSASKSSTERDPILAPDGLPQRDLVRASGDSCRSVRWRDGARSYPRRLIRSERVRYEPVVAERINHAALP